MVTGKPFNDLICVLMGTPRHCPRLEARNKFLAAGGIHEVDITGHIDYVITFEGAEKTQKYQKALKYEQKGRLSFLTEEQFLDVLAGKLSLSRKSSYDSDVDDYTYKKRRACQTQPQE